jgi:phosphoribosyl-ATP pyrophosphohydrolase/phosphoribosyl-AMP cyclohydrolase
MIIDSREQLEAIDFSKGGGLVPLLAQHADSGEVRMLGFADRKALEATLETGEVHFFSRRRKALWRKGETSGNRLKLVSLHVDCDRDAALALVLPAGPTCHTGADSCFGAPPLLVELAGVIEERAAAGARRTEPAAGVEDGRTEERATGASGRTDERAAGADGRTEERAAGVTGQAASGSYTARLLDDRNLRLKKLTEEAGELAVACADDDPARVAEEAADLLYHALVACRPTGVRLDDILATLRERRR